MTKEQALVMAGLFCLIIGLYFILKRKFKVKNSYILINTLLIMGGIAGAFAISPFLYPFDVFRNIPVFLVIPLCAYNFYYLINFILRKYNIGKIIQEVTGFFSILAGAFIGGAIVNLLGFSVFRVVFRLSDIEETLVIVLVLNTVRLLISYAGTVKSLIKKQNEIKELKIKKERTEMQLEALQMKINPHFIYNSLNSIAALSTIDGEKTRDMTIGLSKLLRYSLMYQRNSFASVEEESEIIKEYIEIEKIRFGDDLQFEIHLNKETKKILIPRFILQPVIENCIKHGIIDGKIKITLSSQIKNNELNISVSDNGKPFPEKIEAGLGLRIVSEKLDLLFPGKCELQIRNEPMKELVIIIKELNTEPKLHYEKQD